MANKYASFSKCRTRRACVNKLRYLDLQDAEREAVGMNEKHPEFKFTGYQCSNCGFFHVGRYGLSAEAKRVSQGEAEVNSNKESA